jgi:hypothetical protein
MAVKQLSRSAYRTQSGRVSYRTMAQDLATMLRKRDAELITARRERDEVPKALRVICRIVCRMLRGKGE